VVVIGAAEEPGAEGPDEAALCLPRRLYGKRCLIGENYVLCRDQLQNSPGEDASVDAALVHEVAHRAAGHRNADTLEALLKPIDGNRAEHLGDDEVSAKASAVLRLPEHTSWRRCHLHVHAAAARHALAMNDAL